MSDRIMPLIGVRNFRDFGGYHAVGGAVRRGLLFRSAHFAEASEEDLVALDRLGVTVIVDLRRPQERLAHPSRWVPRVSGAAIVADYEDPHDTAEAPHIALLRQADLTANAVAAFMEQLYTAIPFESRHQRLFRAYFQALVDGCHSASVVHCAAGKDRTGIACALVLTALGVPRDVVMEDYLLTNTAVDLEARAPQIQNMIVTQLGRSIDPAVVRPMLGVDARFLTAAFAAIGDVDRFLADALGVDGATRDRLRARLIE